MQTSRDAARDRIAPAAGEWLLLGDRPPITGVAAEAGDVEVRVVRTPDAFARALSADQPRVAVLALPPAGSAEVQLAVRERERRGNLALVLLNPRDGVDERLRALRAGFDEAFSTEIGSEELAGRLALLAARIRPPRPRSRLIPIREGVDLDLSAQGLRRPEGLVHLPPKTYRMLRLFCGNPGRTFTRRQLLDRVWGRDHDCDPRTVDVHMRWLRERVEGDPNHPVLLLTVRGVGYRFDPPGVPGGAQR